jgi:hypothetical protein
MENIKEKSEEIGNNLLAKYSTEELDLLYSNSVSSGARNNPFSQQLKEEIKKRVSTKEGSKKDTGEATTTEDNNTEQTTKENNNNEKTNK